jgi:hypothetical protein
VGKEDYSRDDRGPEACKCQGEIFAGGKHHRVYNPMKITGKLRIIHTEEQSDEFGTVVVLPLLSIMERG